MKPVIAVVLKPATLIKYHQAREEKISATLFTKNARSARPNDEIVQLVLEMKHQNPRFGYQRIAMQIYQSFGIEISRFVVGRILRNNLKHFPSDKGPSWLTFIGHLTDNLWSIDLFRCESIC